MNKVMCEICGKEPATTIVQFNDVCSKCYRKLWKLVDNDKDEISCG